MRYKSLRNLYLTYKNEVNIGYKAFVKRVRSGKFNSLKEALFNNNKKNMNKKFENIGEKIDYKKIKESKRKYYYELIDKYSFLNKDFFIKERSYYDKVNNIEKLNLKTDLDLILKPIKEKKVDKNITNTKRKKNKEIDKKKKEEKKMNKKRDIDKNEVTKISFFEKSKNQKVPFGMKRRTYKSFCLATKKIPYNENVWKSKLYYKISFGNVFHNTILFKDKTPSKKEFYDKYVELFKDDKDKFKSYINFAFDLGSLEKIPFDEKKWKNKLLINGKKNKIKIFYDEKKRLLTEGEINAPDGFKMIGYFKFKKRILEDNYPLETESLWIKEKRKRGLTKKKEPIKEYLNFKRGKELFQKENLFEIMSEMEIIEKKNDIEEYLKGRKKKYVILFGEKDYDKKVGKVLNVYIKLQEVEDNLYELINIQKDELLLVPSEWFKPLNFKT